MKISTSLFIVLILSILSTLYALAEIRDRNSEIVRRNEVINQLSSDIYDLEKRNDQLSDGIEIISELSSYLKEKVFEEFILVFFPIDGCFACLEDLIVKQIRLKDVRKNLVVYSNAPIDEGIARVNDAYGMNIKILHEGLNEDNSVKELLVFQIKQDSKVTMILPNEDDQYIID